MPPNLPRLSFAGGTLVLDGMTAAKVGHVFGPGRWRWDPRVPAWRCDALEYPAVLRALRSHRCGFTDAVPQWGRVIWPETQLPERRGAAGSL